jgi:hypothetical protein
VSSAAFVHDLNDARTSGFANPTYGLEYSESTPDGVTLFVRNLSGGRLVSVRTDTIQSVSYRKVRASISHLRARLALGQIPSIEIQLNTFNEPSSEDLEWLRVSAFNQED